MLDDALALVRGAFEEWTDDDATQWAAALAYYAAVSVAPLLVLLLAIVGLVWQGPDAQERLVGMIEQQAGTQAGDVARLVVQSEDGGGSSGVLPGIVSTALLLVGASAVFGHLKKALNDMWDVEPVQGGVRQLARGRIMGVLAVLALGVLLLAALVLQTVLSAVAGGPLMSVLNQVGSVVLFTLVFGAVFRTLPDVEIGWREVWLGATATAVLFTLGQLLVGLYLGHSSVGSQYGAAGTLLAFLVWLYYSALVLFFGAELTQVGARRYGTAIEPEEGARRTEGGVTGEEGPRSDGRPSGPSTPPERTTVRGEASYP